MTSTTIHDKYVLNTIFNPNYPLDFNNDQQQQHIDDEEGVELAEKGKYADAIDNFTRAIELAPQWASGYNNRAQAYQLQRNIDGAINDLNMAVSLASVQSNQQKVLCLALTQRGILQKYLGKEDESIEDFKQAAELGSGFAKQQVLLLNPYAAACNQMLSEMLKKQRQCGNETE
ncbi:unnamed protein product [Didymodactylos carnosus]|uniref:Tetratricopeptide repeat protein 36 n=1 Tax=Didymodactylos carnosus TaxID=1234261 RepID=A0A813X6B6_9BILA|nr:unnamed protein product [Didymodactylos carnosus]CAF0862335.1 unnamed protein product [Didymodactylos carnosus]CAF3622688.1 unnamed protein product [Didymodactylos carnosus]CAF3649973.1 unnamed protein product [Didymodactylos carnosus]